MPELPEVETVVRDLRPLLVGTRIRSVRCGEQKLRRAWQPEWQKSVVRQSVKAVRRRGKWIILDLDGGRHLVIHLGMTGQLVVVPSRREVENHTHLVFGLGSKNRELRFRDIRRFGGATLFAGTEELDRFFAETGLGPEPFDVDPEYWRSRLAATNRCLKAILLDQRVIAGIGNIYADESLFEARLHPAHRGRQTTPRQAARLLRAIEDVLNRAIDKHGSSIRNYVGGSGLQGEYQDEFRAYGRTGEPCRRCRTPLVCIRLAGRATHYCPKCQALKS